LGLVVEQLNRYSPTPIQLADPALAKIAVAGRFRLKEVDTTLQLMAELHQLEQRQITQQGKAVIQLFARQ
jgi:transmembrane sensor